MLPGERGESGPSSTGLEGFGSICFLKFVIKILSHAKKRRVFLFSKKSLREYNAANADDPCITAIADAQVTFNLIPSPNEIKRALSPDLYGAHFARLAALSLAQGERPFSIHWAMPALNFALRSFRANISL